MLTLATTTLFGQDFSVTGKVIENQSKTPLEYATISLEPIGNNGKLTGGVTNEKGEFSIKAPQGIYHLKVQFFSFETYEIRNFNLNSDKKLGVITLKDNVQELAGVEVMAERTTVELHLDKKVYNVGQDMTVKGGSVSDVLDNVPSVSVDADGKVSFRGNESVQILINGKPSALSGMNDEALRQLPAESIERVEVISNPSSRYEAEGTAGIINIILKKGSTEGFMGSVTASVGLPEAYELGTNLSLRKQDWTIFGGANLQRRNSPGEATFIQEYFNNSGVTTSFQDEFRHNNRLRQGVNLNAGFEYRFNEKSSITNSVIYGSNDGENVVNTDFFNYDANKNLTTKRFRKNTENDDDYRFQYSLNFLHKFDEEGHKLSADYQYSISNEEEIGLITERNITTATDLTTEKTINDEGTTRHLAQLDYTLPLGKDKKSQFEAGYRGLIEETDIDYTAGDLDNAGNLIVNNNYSNRFIYDQYINAFYSQLGVKHGKWNFMGGLRWEHTNVKSILVNTSQNYSKQYWGLFPSVYLGYEFTDIQQVSVSYSRRLRRPWSRFINPFLVRSSNTNVFGGNPDLNPTYTNAFDVAYLTKLGNFSINTSVYYNHSTEVFEMISIENGEFVNVNGLLVPVTLKHPINLSDEERIGAEFTANFTPKRNWRFSLNFNFFRLKSEGEHSYKSFTGNTITQRFNTETNSWTSRFTAKLPLMYGVDFQTNMMYEAPRLASQSEREGQLSANVAFSKEILKGKGNISLNVSDVFDSRKMVLNTRTANVFTHQEMQWRKRQAMLNFTYRFGSMKSQQNEKERKTQQSTSEPEMYF